MGSYRARIAIYYISFFVLLIVFGALLFYGLYEARIIPGTAYTFLELVAASVIGFIIITLLGREIRVAASRLFGDRTGSSVFVVYRFASYTALAIILLAI